MSPSEPTQYINHISVSDVGGIDVTASSDGVQYPDTVIQIPEKGATVTFSLDDSPPKDYIVSNPLLIEALNRIIKECPHLLTHQLLGQLCTLNGMGDRSTFDTALKAIVVVFAPFGKDGGKSSLTSQASVVMSAARGNTVGDEEKTKSVRLVLGMKQQVKRKSDIVSSSAHTSLMYDTINFKSKKLGSVFVDEATFTIDPSGTLETRYRSDGKIGGDGSTKDETNSVPTLDDNGRLQFSSLQILKHEKTSERLQSDELYEIGDVFLQMNLGGVAQEYLITDLRSMHLISQIAQDGLLTHEAMRAVMCLSATDRSADDSLRYEMVAKTLLSSIGMSGERIESVLDSVLKESVRAATAAKLAELQQTDPSVAVELTDANGQRTEYDIQIVLEAESQKIEFVDTKIGDKSDHAQSIEGVSTDQGRRSFHYEPSTKDARVAIDIAPGLSLVSEDGGAKYVIVLKIHEMIEGEIKFSIGDKSLSASPDGTLKGDLSLKDLSEGILSSMNRDDNLPTIDTQNIAILSEKSKGMTADMLANSAHTIRTFTKACDNPEIAISEIHTPERAR